MVMRNRKIPIFYTFVPLARYKMENTFFEEILFNCLLPLPLLIFFIHIVFTFVKLQNGVAFVVWRNKCKGINTPSVKRQRQGPIGMHCDAPKSVPDPFPSINPSLKTAKLPLPLPLDVGIPKNARKSTCQR